MDDDLSTHEQSMMNAPTAWRGTAIGGPLDGSQISVGAVPHLPMRGLVFYVCVGEEPESAEWHAYTLQMSLDSPFVHLGTIKGDPPSPEA